MTKLIWRPKESRRNPDNRVLSKRLFFNQIFFLLRKGQTLKKYHARRKTYDGIITQFLALHRLRKLLSTSFTRRRISLAPSFTLLLIPKIGIFHFWRIVVGRNIITFRIKGDMIHFQRSIYLVQVSWKIFVHGDFIF